LREDVERAVREMGETFDIAEEDLEDLLLRAEDIAAERQGLRSERFSNVNDGEAI
jgi:CBS-domain-containing membrane protein